jgi:hypothetical protein
VQVRGVYVPVSYLDERKFIAGRAICVFWEDCPISYPMVLVTYKIAGSSAGSEINRLLSALKLGGYPKPLYVYVDSGGFQLLTGKADSVPEGVVSSVLGLADFIGDSGVVYMTLLDYPASTVGMPKDEFERRVEKTVEYYSRQLGYYYRGGRERRNVRVMMPVHGWNPERVSEFMGRVAHLIRDYGLTGFSISEITGMEARDASWFYHSLARTASLVKGVLGAGSRVEDLHFLGFFEKRLWLVGAFAQIPELRTVTADSNCFAGYTMRYSMILMSIPNPVQVKLKEARVLPCNCPFCRVAREAGAEEKVVQGVGEYTAIPRLHNVYEYLRFAEVAFRYPRVGFEAMGMDYDSFLEKVRMAVRGELDAGARGILGFAKR